MKTFAQAVSTCSSYGMTLATFVTAEEFNKVYDLVSE